MIDYRLRDYAVSKRFLLTLLSVSFSLSSLQRTESLTFLERSLKDFLGHDKAIPSFLHSLNQFLNDQYCSFINSAANLRMAHISAFESAELSNFKLFISVEYLLNHTNVKVIVYNGIFDFIVNTSGKFLL